MEKIIKTIVDKYHDHCKNMYGNTKQQQKPKKEPKKVKRQFHSNVMKLPINIF